ncbi:hypothetical protein GE09DRAFT_1291502 [Coniochaeta sp. 2T2.1]|nr:hypothetical protein GE09DRAFT_1291502 [Coniochaeta sp. 2T2.1]
MAQPAPTVLITGCSDGGAGAALAIAFHKAGYHVYATTRNTAKMEDLRERGIETLALDVQSDSSIAQCVAHITAAIKERGLDILVNNAGCQYTMPVADIDISLAKQIYDLNVFSNIAVTQAFLPLLLMAANGDRSRSIIANHTSTAACLAIPFQSIYNSSKAALASLSNTMRLELAPFKIKVVDIRSGIIKTNLIKNLQDLKHPTLPLGSVYDPAREIMGKILRQENFEAQGTPVDQWADLVVEDLKKQNLPPVIWRGESALTVWISTVLPFGVLDGTLKKLTGLDTIAQVIREHD